MATVFNYNIAENKRSLPGALLLLLLAAAILPLTRNNNSFEPGGGPKYMMLMLTPEGYDAKTGKWVNKKPSTYAFAITPETYQKVKNWYATDSGTNNPNQLEVEAPKEGYTYLYIPYHDPKHPNSVGMSSFGQEGYKGYWYADDLSKATDSITGMGDDAPITPPADNPNPNVNYGGYDARTGQWISNTPSEDAYSVSPGTYNRIKNWYATGFGVNNPLDLPILVPREGYTYVYVPFNDPKHPGIVGMSFQGDNAYRGYWYADKIPGADTALNNTQNNTTTPVQSQQQAAPPPVLKQDN